MNIAFCVCAHTDFAELTRLLDRLLNMGDVFLHIDKKNGQLFEDVVNLFSKKCEKDGLNISTPVNSNLFKVKDKTLFLVKPTAVAWGGFSQAMWIELTIRAAMNFKEYDRLFTLSGLDYPLWTDQQIVDYCERHKDEQWLTVWNISTHNDPGQDYRIKYYHLFRDIPLPHKSLLRRVIIVGARTLLRFAGLRKPKRIKTKDGLADVYTSSSWIGITGVCCKYILHLLDTDPSFHSYFKYSYTPDEMMFSTLIMHSPFRNGITELHDEMIDNLATRTPLHFIIYNGWIYTFGINDYDKLKESGKMFVRKLVSGQSESLIKKLDEDNRKD